MKKSIEFKRLLILDGYNVIHKFPEALIPDVSSLQKKRELLLKFLKTWKQQTGFHGKIMVVYDGKDNVGNPKEIVAPGIEAHFSRTNEEADSRIVTILKSVPDTAKVVVVSDDNFVINHCRSFRASRKPVSYLLSKQKKTSRQDRTRSGKNIDENTQNSINKMLKDEWGIE